MLQFAAEIEVVKTSSNGKMSNWCRTRIASATSGHHKSWASLTKEANGERETGTPNPKRNKRQKRWKERLKSRNRRKRKRPSWISSLASKTNRLTTARTSRACWIGSGARKAQQKLLTYLKQKLKSSHRDKAKHFLMRKKKSSQRIESRAWDLTNNIWLAITVQKIWSRI